MGTPLGPKYIPYTYMDPLGIMPYHGIPDRRIPCSGVEEAREPRAEI